MSVATLRWSGAARRAGSKITAAAPGTALNLLVRLAERASRRPDVLRERLVIVRSSPALLEKFSRRSYWHSNGFAKIKVADSGRMCLRIHVWPGGLPRRGDVDPHGHRWEFASWVAIGRGLVERYFENSTAADADAFRYIRCDYGPRNPGGGLVAREDAWLRQRRARMMPAGTVYSCARDIVHTVAPIGTGLITTVVLQGPARADSAPVYIRPGRSVDGGPEPLSPAELGDLLGAVVSALARGRGVGASPVGRPNR